MKTDVTKLSLERLKSLAFDEYAKRETVIENLRILIEEIRKREASIQTVELTKKSGKESKPSEEKDSTHAAVK